MNTERKEYSEIELLKLEYEKEMLERDRVKADCLSDLVSCPMCGKAIERSRRKCPYCKEFN